MAVGIRVVAASTVIFFLLSFLSILKVKSRHKLLLGCVPCHRPLKWPACMLQVFHNGISAQLNPDASSLLLSLQTLEAQLASQNQRYTVLQHQLEQLELSIAATTGSAASIRQTRPLPNNVSFTQEHKLAVLVPYRDREQHLAKLVSRIDKYLMVGLHLALCAISMLQGEHT